MATRPITVNPYEINVLFLASCNLASASFQNGDLQTAGDMIKRMGELHLAMKEALAAMPRSANSAEGKRA